MTSAAQENRRDSEERSRKLREETEMQNEMFRAHILQPYKYIEGKSTTYG